MLYRPPLIQPEEFLIFDAQQLREATGNELALIEEVLSLYETDYEERMLRAHQCLQAEDYEGFHREIHTLKGSSGAIGAKRLEHVFNITLRTFKKEGFESCTPYLQSLPQVIQEFKEYLQTFRAQF